MRARCVCVCVCLNARARAFDFAHRERERVLSRQARFREEKKIVSKRHLSFSLFFLSLLTFSDLLFSSSSSYSQTKR